MNAVIVEDELHARRFLLRCLAKHHDLNVVGVCSDGASAVKAITALRPDVVFLDIRIPDPDGFEVLNAIPNGFLPLVVFVTAYNDFAVQAFDVNAADYIVKPFEESRIDRSVERIRMIRSAGIISTELEKIRAVLSDESSVKSSDIFIVKNRGILTPIPFQEIESIEADGDYVRITSKRSHTVHMTLQQASEQFPEYFLRIHRSVIVNSRLIKEMHSRLRGDYAVHLYNGRILTMSRTYRPAVLSALKKLSTSTR